MPSAACFSLPDWLGATKTAGIRVVSAYIGSLPVNARFSDERLQALAAHHPTRPLVAPASSPALCFVLRVRPPYFTKALFVESRAGGLVDLSWRKCVANFFGKHSGQRSARLRALGALRSEAFASDKMRAARASLGRRCAECGKACRKLVVDHAGPTPFAQIADEYVASLGGGVSLANLPLRYREGAYGLRSGADAWRAFHDERAELVGLCAPCNMRLGSRGYRRARRDD